MDSCITTFKVFLLRVCSAGDRHGDLLFLFYILKNYTARSVIESYKKSPSRLSFIRMVTKFHGFQTVKFTHKNKLQISTAKTERTDLL